MILSWIQELNWLSCLFFPQTRGWSCRHIYKLDNPSVFPAYAGVIPFKMVWIHSFTCFSRTCGGDPGAVSILVILAGFFPHMRGWSWFIEHKNEPNAVFPAYAGVIPIQRIKTIAFYCFSRIRGGYPEITCHLSFKFSFFPHTRGWSWSRLGA